jgi:hypothetical protein
MFHATVIGRCFATVMVILMTKFRHETGFSPFGRGKPLPYVVLGAPCRVQNEEVRGVLQHFCILHSLFDILQSIISPPPLPIPGGTGFLPLQ